MKKIMIAAVAAIAASVTFDATASDDCGLKGCIYAYRLKLAGKTVKGKSLAASSECETGNCWAKKASLRIAGYLYKADEAESDCDCTCEDNTLLGAKSPDFIFWNEKKEEVVFDSVEIALAEILRNSGAKDKAQILIKLDDINLAGFGVYNPQTLKLKRAHGFFAGLLPAAQCMSPDPDDKCSLVPTTAQVFAPCDLSTAVDSEGSIAYGRWNLAYKSEKVALIKSVGIDGALKPAAFKAASDS